ncbi:MAG: glutamine amidotransferase, class [Caulobacteraceae bacterium]|nr:glutamine amidotransferase, class [Caulobacteraceae bacterium]
MRLGVLKTGQPPEPEHQRFGGYPEMFKALLGPEAYDYTVYAADEGELPAGPRDCDAYLVTGSSCGVYDGLPWIDGLLDFLNRARGQAALVGVCFGHQAMAQAFGGQVVKAPQGWGVGLQTYEVLGAEPWMDVAAAEVRLPASHQDQVVVPPPGTEVFAASAFSPYGGLVWRDQPAMSIQLHPEFQPAYAKALIEARRGSRYSDEQADAAIATYAGADDRALVGGWIARFLALAT